MYFPLEKQMRMMSYLSFFHHFIKNFLTKPEQNYYFFLPSKSFHFLFNDLEQKVHI